MPELCWKAPRWGGGFCWCLFAPRKLPQPRTPPPNPTLPSLQDSRGQSAFLLEQLQQQAADLGQAAAAMPMRVQKIESTMALLETGDLKLRVGGRGPAGGGLVRWAGVDVCVGVGGGLGGGGGGEGVQSQQEVSMMESTPPRHLEQPTEGKPRPRRRDSCPGPPRANALPGCP